MDIQKIHTLENVDFGTLAEMSWVIKYMNNYIKCVYIKYSKMYKLWGLAKFWDIQLKTYVVLFILDKVHRMILSESVQNKRNGDAKCTSGLSQILRLVVFIGVT